MSRLRCPKVQPSTVQDSKVCVNGEFGPLNACQRENAALNSEPGNAVDLPNSVAFANGVCYEFGVKKDIVRSNLIDR